MSWNWEQDDWPALRFDADAIAPFEDQFLEGGGVLTGAARHLREDAREALTVEVLSSEALKTSEIEGEILDRASVRSSIRRFLGLSVDRRRSGLREQGIAELMVELHQHFEDPLTDQLLFEWHELVLAGRRDVEDIGRYRTHPEAMRVVSGPAYSPEVHFEAPPSPAVPVEMSRFIDWFNGSGPGNEGGHRDNRKLRPLARAGMAHLYFVSIHPFEDGNGRVGRAISDKALAQGLGHPSLAALAATFEGRRKGYYRALEGASRSNEVTPWLLWFSDAVLAAQARTTGWVSFFIDKARFFDRVGDAINERQRKVLLRMSREGPEGFEGGLSAGNYARITGAAPATARRDLVKLVEMGALTRTGERNGTRYWLPFGECGVDGEG